MENLELIFDHCEINSGLEDRHRRVAVQPEESLRET